MRDSTVAALLADWTYRVAVPNFFENGGEGFTVFREGSNRSIGPMDIDAIVEYISSQTQAIEISEERRITRIS